MPHNSRKEKNMQGEKQECTNIVAAMCSVRPCCLPKKQNRQIDNKCDGDLLR